MAFVLDAWLKELGFQDSEVAELTGKLSTPERLAKLTELHEGNLRQADYSRQMATLQKTQEDLATKESQVIQEMAEWAQLKGTDSQEAATLRTQLDALQLEKLQLTQAVTKLATQVGVDPATVLPKPGPEPPPKPVDKPAPDSVTADQFLTTSRFLLDLNVELPMIAAEHEALTGKKLDTRAFMADLRKAATKSAIVTGEQIREVWERTNDIPAKREAQVKVAHDAEMKAEYDRGQQDARSVAALPGAHPAGQRAVVFRHDEHGQPVASKLLRPQPLSRTLRAAEALRTHKYATPEK